MNNETAIKMIRHMLLQNAKHSAFSRISNEKFFVLIDLYRKPFHTVINFQLHKSKNSKNVNSAIISV